MLQFLVGVQLLNCQYQIPQLRTTIQYNGYQYRVQNGEFRIDESFYPLEASWVDISSGITPLAVIVYRTSDCYLQIRLLSTTGEEHTYDCGNTGRDSECWPEYLV